MQQPISTLMRGALSGLAGTAAMSVPLLVASRREVIPETPPRSIARTALSKSGLSPGKTFTDVAGTVAHFGFGAACGIAMTALWRQSPSRTVPPVLFGVSAGLAVWAVSYQGWVPALGALPPATRDVPRRQATMVLSHVVFGAVVGAFLPARRLPLAS